MSFIKLMLVDHYETIKARLGMVLHTQPDIEIVAQVNSRSEAAPVLQTHQPNVVLMDIMLWDMNEIDSIHQIKTCQPTVDILTLVVYEGFHKKEDYFLQLFNAGASGCIPSQITSQDLLRAIRTVYCGEVFFQPLATLSSNLLQRGWGDLTADSPHLTKREREVLLLIAHGLTHAQIGRQLNMSIPAVAMCQYNITQKLNLSGRADLAHYAIQKGLVSL